MAILSPVPGHRVGEQFFVELPESRSIVFVMIVSEEREREMAQKARP